MSDDLKVYTKNETQKLLGLIGADLGPPRSSRRYPAEDASITKPNRLSQPRHRRMARCQARDVNRPRAD